MESAMKSVLFALLLSGCAACALARPIPLVPTRIDVPSPYQPLVATIEGDDIFALARSGSELALMQFHRQSNGEWLYARTLLLDPNGYDGRDFEDIDMDGDLLAALLAPERIAIFERDGGAWTRGVLAATQNPGESTTISASQGRILVGVTACERSSMVIANDANGVWRQTGHLRGSQVRYCDPFYTAHPGGDLDGSDVLAYELDSYEWHEDQQSQLWWYRDSGQFEWPRFATTSLPSPETPSIHVPGVAAVTGYHKLALSEGHAFILSGPGPFEYALRPEGRIEPTSQQGLRTIDDAMSEAQGDVVADHDLLAVDLSQGRMGEMVHIWQRNASGSFEYVALAHAKDAQSIRKIDLSGHSLVVASIEDAEPFTHGALWVYDIPQSFSTPAPRQQDFEDDDASQWQPIGASQLAIARSGHSRVLRQSNASANTGALLADTDWSNQSVQADIRVTDFPASDGFVALVSRYRDFYDYYYVSLRHGDRLALRKKVGGVVTELAAADFPVTPGRTYRVRLDTRADDLYASVDGAVVLHARDRSLSHGAAGFRGYDATYDIDNLLVSPLSSTLYQRDSADRYQQRPWSFETGQWSAPDENTIQQTAWHSTFAVIGEPTDDEIVECHARVDAFNPASTAAWAGVVARYADRHDFYSLVLRSNGAVQLRKVVDGTTTLLAGRVLSVTPGAEYLLRLDVTGNRLRGYVDGVLQIEATDDTLTQGRTGLATYQTKASYSTYLAYQP
jgi:hypothetical protein